MTQSTLENALVWRLIRHGLTVVAVALLALSSAHAVNRRSAQADFGIVIDARRAELIAGAETKFIVTFNSISGFAGWVQPRALGIEGVRGATGSWSVPNVRIPAGGSAKATFTMLTLLDTPVGSYPIVFQGIDGSLTHQTAVITVTVKGPPEHAITAAFHPDAPIVGFTTCAITGNATSGGWITDISTFPDGSVHSFSFKSNGAGAYTDGPFVLKQLGTYHDVLVDTETGGRQAIAYHGAGDFSATIDRPRRTVMSGQEAQFLVTFSSLSGFAGVVRPQVENVADLGQGTATWSLSSVDVRPGVLGSSRLTIKTARVSSAVALRIRVKGANGSVAHAAPDIELNVVPP